LWSNGATGDQAVNLIAGNYVVTVTDNNGCTSTFEHSVFVELPKDAPEVNNVFSPNGDGINEYWVIDNLMFYPQNELVVINRWGNEVLTLKNYQNDWNGSDLSEGTYFYILKVEMCDGEHTMNGYVTILR
jgi:gliding motility-associated-like protein